MATLVLKRFSAFLLPSLLLKYFSATEGFIPCEEDCRWSHPRPCLTWVRDLLILEASWICLWPPFNSLPFFLSSLSYSTPFLSIFCVLNSLLLLPLFLVRCPSSSVTVCPSPLSFAHATLLCRSFGKELKSIKPFPWHVYPFIVCDMISCNSAHNHTHTLT